MAIASWPLWLRLWGKSFFDEAEFYAAILVSGLIWLLTTTVALWGINRFRRWNEPEAPPFWRRASSAAWVVLFTAAPPAATTASFYLVLKLTGLVDATVDHILLAVLAAVSTVAGVNAIAATLLAPGKPHWRIFVASDKIAARIRWLCVGMAAVFGADLIMSAFNEELAAPLSLAIAQNIIASIAFATLGMALFLMPSNSIEVEGRADLRWLRFLRFPFAAAALAIFVCALIGYAALARFLAAQIVVTGAITVMLYLTFIAVDALAESLKDEKAISGRWLEEKFGLDERERALVALPIALVLKITALAAAMPFDDASAWLRLGRCAPDRAAGVFRLRHWKYPSFLCLPCRRLSLSSSSPTHWLALFKNGSTGRCWQRRA